MNTLFQKRQSRSAKSRAAILTECALLLLGFVCVGWFVYEFVERSVAQKYEAWALDAEVRGESPSWTGFVKDLFRSDDEKRSREQERQAEDARRQDRPAMKPGSLVGRIEIPRIKVSATVREGSDDKTLKRAAGHIPNTSLPGEDGNVGIAAHRDSFFRNLRNIKEGDEIRMVTTWGTYRYEVHSLKIVTPNDVHVLNPGPEPLMTLVTCYPFNYVGSAPKRFIVQAREIGTESEPVPASAERRVKKMTVRKS